MKNSIIILTIALVPFILVAQESEKEAPHEIVEERHDAHMEKIKGTKNEAAEKKNEPYEIKTLLGNQKRGYGGYFTLNSFYGKVGGQDAFSVGAYGGYLMNHIFLIGMGANGFVNDIKLKKVIPGKDIYLQCGYGGFLLEPVIASRFPVHVSFPVLIGGGAIAYNKQGYYNDLGEDNPYEDWKVIDSDVFFVIEPGLNLEFNVAKFFRIGLEGKYRYVNGLQMMNTSSNMMNGWSGGLNLKFGKF